MKWILHLCNPVEDIRNKHEILYENHLERVGWKNENHKPQGKLVVSVSVVWNWFRIGCVGVITVIGVKNVERLCGATRTACGIQHCRENWKCIEINVRAVQGNEK
jgi:hypothetical protein